jgi:dTDP-4-dehydrorhamnose reductase
MRALILGARGNLGQTLLDVLPRAGFAHVEGQGGRRECDLRDAPLVERVLRAGRPDVVFNAAAYAKVDAAEREPGEAWSTNVEGTAILARACAAARVRLVHYSTDFVFDGRRHTAYEEMDPTSPLGVYARSKAAGEARVLDACPSALVLRVGCLYGRQATGFPSSIAPRLARGEPLACDDVRLASPTWLVRAAEGSAAASVSRHEGLLHLTAHGSTTWAGFARHLAGRLAAPAALIRAADPGSLGLAAERPMSAILSKGLLGRLELDRLGTWQEQADAYVADLARSPSPAAPPAPAGP